MTKEEYERFYDALVAAESATVHDFDKATFFEGCLPIEVMAHRGRDTLRFGPMKPVGLVDPRTGRRPYAVVQLRQDTLAGDHWSLVGFQTQIKWGDQARVLRLIPGLENAEFVRLGMVHRNTYINGPTVLRDTWQTRARADLLFAGQVSGVEGYVESAASGLIAGRNAAALALGEPPASPPRTTAIGALAYYVSHAEAKHYQPSNITFGIMAPLDDTGSGRPKKGGERREAIAVRALRISSDWQAAREGGARRGRRAGGRRDLTMARPLPARRGLQRPPRDEDRGALRQAIRDFIDYLRLNRNASAHTARAYESDLEQFVTAIAASEDRPRPSLTPADFSPDNVPHVPGRAVSATASRARAPRESSPRSARSRAGCVAKASSIRIRPRSRPRPSASRRFRRTCPSTR